MFTKMEKYLTREMLKEAVQEHGGIGPAGWHVVDHDTASAHCLDGYSMIKYLSWNPDLQCYELYDNSQRMDSTDYLPAFLCQVPVSDVE